MNRAELVMRISEACAEYEGFYKTNSPAQRNNNPGNLRSWGKTPVVDGFAKFPTPVEGWNALRRQVDKNVGRGLTLVQFFAGVRDASGKVLPGKYSGYAPAADKNYPTRYAAYVAKRVQIPADVPLNKLYVKSDAI